MDIDFNEVLGILKTHRKKRDKQVEYLDEENEWYAVFGSESIEILTKCPLRIVNKKWSDYFPDS